MTLIDRSESPSYKSRHPPSAGVYVFFRERIGLPFQPYSERDGTLPVDLITISRLIRDASRLVRESEDVHHSACEDVQQPVDVDGVVSGQLSQRLWSPVLVQYGGASPVVDSLRVLSVYSHQEVIIVLVLVDNLHCLSTFSFQFYRADSAVLFHPLVVCVV